MLILQSTLSEAGPALSVGLRKASSLNKVKGNLADINKPDLSKRGAGLTISLGEVHCIPKHQLLSLMNF